MYYNGFLSILALFRFNWKLFFENIRKFKELLGRYYKVTFILRKGTNNTANNHYKRGTKWKFKWVYYWKLMAILTLWVQVNVKSVFIF